MSKVKVSFGDPSHGWIAINIQSADQVVDIDASFIYNAFYPLVEILRLMKSTEVKSSPNVRIVTCLCEPTQYDLCFESVGVTIKLNVIEYPGTTRTRFQQEGTLVLSATGGYDEICLPFWRALRELQSRFSQNELETRWQDTFPYQELDDLTVLLGKG